MERLLEQKKIIPALCSKPASSALSASACLAGLDQSMQQQRYHSTATHFSNAFARANAVLASGQTQAASTSNEISGPRPSRAAATRASSCSADSPIGPHPNLTAPVRHWIHYNCTASAFSPPLTVSFVDESAPTRRCLRWRVGEQGASVRCAHEKMCQPGRRGAVSTIRDKVE